MNTTFWLIAAGLFLGTILIARMTQVGRPTGPLIRAFQVTCLIGMLVWGLMDPRRHMIAFAFVMFGAGGLYRRWMAERR